MIKTSVRRRLIVWLLIPLSVIIALGSAVAYHVAKRASQDSLDLFLLDTALDLEDQLKIIEGSVIILDLSPSAQEILTDMVGDKVYFAVRNTEGDFVAGHKGFPPTPAELQMKQRAYYNGYFQGERVRVVSTLAPLTEGFAHIQVAQTLNESEQMLEELLFELLGPAVIMMLTSVAVIWFGLRRGLEPLDDMSTQLASRSHDDLRPISPRDTPKELRPVVQAINGLLSRIQDSVESRNRFFANAAHQLRTPLAALQAHAEAIQARVTGAPVAQDIGDLVSATQRTTHLANQLLTLARAEPGGIAEQRSALQLDAMARALADEWVPRALRARIDLGFELAPAAVSGNALLVRELLANLIDNAVKYTPSGGHVTVRTGVSTGAPWLEVVDDGPGIPESERRPVIERFYRGEGVAGEGCGLGLAIVDEIARAHQATLVLASGPGGKGLLARVTFPQISSPAA